jgi:glycosyltransferase involved in cell wall biosynthesis
MHLQTDRIVVGYVGRLKTLFMEKGVKHLLEALKELQSEKKFIGLIVGGPAVDVQEYKLMAQKLGLTSDDIHFTGEVPGSTVPAMLSACDILAMPFPDFPHYRFHMSPLKMFEYMAANRPIITSDLPTVRDVLSEETAFFCVPGDSHSLASVLQAIASDRSAASSKAAAARQLIERHTWEERMKRILSAV